MIKLHTYPIQIPQSFLIAYMAYVFLLQTTTFFSRRQFLFGVILWVGIYLLLIAFKKWYPAPGASLNKYRIQESLGLLLLVSIIANGYIEKIPYTYLILPEQTIRIRPAAGTKSAVLILFQTEISEWIGLQHFSNNEAWQLGGDRLTLKKETTDTLVWQGKPGQYTRLTFETCETCGPVEVDWGDGVFQSYDIPSKRGRLAVEIEHAYASLGWMRAVNLAALELGFLVSAFLVIDYAAKGRGHNPKGQEGRRGKNSKNPTEKPGWGLSNHFWAITGLGLFTLVIFAFKIEPILFNDDWERIRLIHFGDLDAFMAANRRPLHVFHFWLFSQFLPIHSMVYALHIFQMVLLFTTAVLLYFMIGQILDGYNWFAFLAALLYLVYPADYTRTYITMIGLRLPFVLLLAVFILLRRAVRTENLRTLVPTCTLLVLSLLMYEGQLGLAAVWPILLLFIYRWDLGPRAYFIYGVYYATMGLFVAWKLFFQPQIYQDSKIEFIAANLSDSLRQMPLAFRTIWGGFKFPLVFKEWITFENGFLMAFLILLGLAAYRYIGRAYNPQDPTKEKQVFDYAILGGFVLWLAGLFPLHLNYPPNIYGHLSRVNLYAIPGASIFLIAIIHRISLSLRLHKNRIKATTLIALAITLAGSIIQLQAQDAYIQSWRGFETFYAKMFEAVPQIKPNTNIVLLLDDYAKKSTTIRPLYSSSWEARQTMQVLYDEKSLLTYYRYQKIKVPPFPTLNVLTSTLHTKTIPEILPAEKLLVISYSRKNQALQVLTDATGLNWVADPENYTPWERIIPTEEHNPSRMLVKP